MDRTGLDRTDRWLGALAVVWLISFVLSMLHHAEGKLAMPLDDSFIYFQYARQAAEGHFMRYNTGDPPTTGCTSLLYMLLLVPGCWAGFRGTGLVVFALALGLICLILSAGIVRRVGQVLGDAKSGTAAALLFLLCGPLLWGFFSGMEIGLFSLLILLTFYFFVAEEREGKPRVRTMLAASALALARPEGFFLVLILVGVVLARACLQRRWSGIGWSGLPLVAWFLQAVLLKGLTGSWGSAGLEAKWRFLAPHASLPEVVRFTLFDFAAFVKGILGGSLGEQTSVNLFAYDGNSRGVFFAPFFLLFFLAEAAPRIAGEVRQRCPGPGLLGCAWLFGGILLTCTLVEADAHFNRYQQPFLPLFILFAALGVQRLGAIVGERGRNLGLGLHAFYGLWGLGSVLFFLVAYGENCADIRHQQMAMARFIGGNLPAEARIAINDAGAIKYLGNRHTVDLVGLTSPGLARAWRHGSGSLYEHLEAMPPEQRPDYFAIFPNWFSFEPAGFLQPLHRIRVFGPSIIDAEKVLYRADWMLAHSGVQIRSLQLQEELAGFRVVDRVDVADLQSEEAHGYSSSVWEVGQEEANLLMSQVYEEDPQMVVIDGGRTVTRTERMRVSLRPSRPARMVMRTVTGIHQHFAVYASGQLVAEVKTPGGPGRSWRELQAAAIPALVIGDGEVEVETRAIHAGGSVRPIVSFHYWFLQ